MLTFLWVERTRDPHLRALEEDYLARIGRYERRVDVIAVPTSRGRVSPAERAEREGAALIERLPSRGLTVALDQGGEALGTEHFTSRVLQRRGEGVSLLIGGEEGLSDRVLDLCGKVVSLGPMTLPHELARVVLLEQVYRGLSLLAGSPYHRSDRAGRARLDPPRGGA